MKLLKGNLIQSVGEGIFEFEHSMGENDIQVKNPHIDFPCDDDGCYPVCNFKPIQLTEKWLLRFGFECIEDNQLKSLDLLINNETVLLFSNIEDNYSEVAMFYREFGETGQSVICRVTTVHQLQNLYLALTGEELTLKKIS